MAAEVLFQSFWQQTLGGSSAGSYASKGRPVLIVNVHNQSIHSSASFPDT